MSVREPKPGTLKRYGLSIEEWREMLASQGGVCAVCGKLPPSGRLVTDHEHVAKWRHMPPEMRKQFVRGVLCWTCNHYTLGRGASVSRLTNGARYLASYEKRRPK